MAYGTAPHRVAPGVWATQDGRRLTPAGSRYWEDHYRRKMVTADGHVPTSVRVARVLDPTKPSLPAPKPPPHRAGTPNITPKQWAGMTPKQKMDTQVTVTLSPHDRAVLAKLRAQQRAAHPAPKGYHYGPSPPIPTKVNQPIGFGGASSIDTTFAKMAAEEAAREKARQAAWLKAHPPRPTQLETARAQMTAQGQANFPKAYAKAHAYNTAGHSWGDIALGAIGDFGTSLGKQIGSDLGLDKTGIFAYKGTPSSGLAPRPPQVLGQAATVEEGLLKNAVGPDLTKLALHGQVGSVPGLAVDVAGILPIPGLKGIRTLRRGAVATKRAERAAATMARARGAVTDKIVANVSHQNEITRLLADAAPEDTAALQTELDALQAERIDLVKSLDRFEPTAPIDERVTWIENWRRKGAPDEKIKAALAFHDNQAAHYPEGKAAWWRDKMGHPPGMTPGDITASQNGRVLYQRTPEAAKAKAKITPKERALENGMMATEIPEDAEGLGLLYPEGIKTPPLGPMPRIKGMTPALWSLLKRGAPYRDWYERGAAVIGRFAEDVGITNRQAVGIVAVTSQGANPTYNLKRAAEMINEWKASGGKVGVPGSGFIEPSTRFAGQATKVAHILENPETFKWSGLKTNNYFANFMEELDPAFYKEVYKGDPKVTVDRHIANMLLGKKGVTKKEDAAAQDLFIRTAKKLGWKPKEAQAAAWVIWKAEQSDIRQQMAALSREMRKRGEIPKRLLVKTKDKEILKARAAYVQKFFDAGRRAEGHVPKGWQAYLDNAQDAYGVGERAFSKRHGGTLYQRDPASELPKGATEFLHGDRTRVHYFEGADVDTAMHELLHVSIWDLKGRHLDTLADEYAGGKALHDWTDAEHEAVADAFEQWLRTGEITNEKLRGPFQAIKDWMGKIIGRSKDAGFKVPQDVEDAFNHMFREAPDVTLEEQAVGAAKRAPKIYEKQLLDRKAAFGERMGKLVESGQETSGVAAHKLQKEALAGKMPREYVDDLTHLTGDDLDLLRESVQRTKLTDIQKINLFDALQAAQRGEVLRPSDVKLVLKAWAPPGTPGRGRTLKEWAYYLINEIINIPRSIMASGDLSGVFRQSLTAFAMHPALVAKEIGPMMKYFLSEKAYIRNQEFFATDAAAQRYAAHGTDFTDVHHGGGLENREEQFVSSFAEWLTGGKHGLVRRSGRAYTGLLNNVRYALNENMERIAARQTRYDSIRTSLGHAREPVVLTSEELDNMSRVANWATGRGHLGALETQAMLLNTFLFSPRLLKSRIDMINPGFYLSLGKNSVAQREALRGVVQLILGGASVLGMAKLSGLDVVLDPFSSDFGKIKIGNHRFDIWGGQTAVARTILQEAWGTKTIVSTGEHKPQHLFEPTLNFIRGKSSPPVGLVFDIGTGRSIIGEKPSWKKTPLEHITPLAWQDAFDSYMDDHNVGWGLGALTAATFGVGINTFGMKDPNAGSGAYEPDDGGGSSSAYEPDDGSSGSKAYEPPG